MTLAAPKWCASVCVHPGSWMRCQRSIVSCWPTSLPRKSTQSRMTQWHCQLRCPTLRVLALNEQTRTQPLTVPSRPDLSESNQLASQISDLISPTGGLSSVVKVGFHVSSCSRDGTRPAKAHSLTHLSSSGLLWSETEAHVTVPWVAICFLLGSTTCSSDACYCRRRSPMWYPRPSNRREPWLPLQ